jgi:hypothetical protein
MVTLGYKGTSWTRLCLLYDHPWMWNLVKRKQIQLSLAYSLLDAATKMGPQSVEDLRGDLAAIVKQKKRQVDLLYKDAKRKPDVAACFDKHVTEAWVRDIKKGLRIKPVAPYSFGAFLAPDRNGSYRLSVPTVSLPVTPANADKLWEIAIRLDEVVTALCPQINAMQVAKEQIGSGPGDESRSVETAKKLGLLRGGSVRTDHDQAKLTVEDTDEAWRHPADREQVEAELREADDELEVEDEQPAADSDVEEGEVD